MLNQPLAVIHVLLGHVLLALVRPLLAVHLLNLGLQLHHTHHAGVARQRRDHRGHGRLDLIGHVLHRPRGDIPLQDRRNHLLLLGDQLHDRNVHRLFEPVLDNPDALGAGVSRVVALSHDAAPPLLAHRRGHHAGRV